jgi:hypothetical protein
MQLSDELKLNRKQLDGSCGHEQVHYKQMDKVLVCQRKFITCEAAPSCVTCVWEAHWLYNVAGTSASILHGVKTWVL